MPFTGGTSSAEVTSWTGGNVFGWGTSWAVSGVLAREECFW